MSTTDDAIENVAMTFDKLRFTKPELCKRGSERTRGLPIISIVWLRFMALNVVKHVH